MVSTEDLLLILTLTGVAISTLLQVVSRITTYIKEARRPSSPGGGRVTIGEICALLDDLSGDFDSLLTHPLLRDYMTKEGIEEQKIVNLLSVVCIAKKVEENEIDI